MPFHFLATRPNWRRTLAPAAVALAVVAVVAIGTAPLGSSNDIANAAAAPQTIDIGTAASMRMVDQLIAPDSAEPEYFPPGLTLDTSWVVQTATEPDPTGQGNKITPRTSFMLQSAINAGLTKVSSVTCVGQRSSNPTSDHPAGRACDFMFDYSTPQGVAAGWKAANWLIANQSVLGVKYLIWQGLYWGASNRPGPWTVYTSSAYGCPNPLNINGCHYNHVHVSMY